MNPYYEQMILSASPIELVRLMYQRAIALVADAREHLRGGRIRERVQAITRVHAILTELLVSLDADKAPELAANLRKLYCYMQQRLVDANFSQTDGPLEETGRLLVTMADAWREIPKTGSAAESPYAGGDAGTEDETSHCEALIA